MTCERAHSLMTDAITGQIDPKERRLLDDHVSSCPTCRTEFNSLVSTWDALGNLHSPSPPVDALDKLLMEMKNPSTSPRIVPLWLSRVAVIAVVFLVGALAGYGLRGPAPPAEELPETLASDNPAEADLMNRYLLVLRQPEGFTDQPEELLVGEYRDWGNGLGQTGHLETGEKLREGAIWMQGDTMSESPPADPGHVAGYFIIRASNYQEAVELVRPSPHLKYGGVVEMREIDPLDGNP